MIFSLQTLRFVAASMVLFLHAVQSAMRISGVGTVPYQYALVGSAGVDIFFVISGVIMATVAPGRTAAEFIQARVLRVVPIYLLCSIPALPIMVGFGMPEAADGPVLSPREIDVLTQVALGLRNEEVAQRLSLSAETVKSYLRSAAVKLGTHSRYESVHAARRLGLLA